MNPFIATISCVLLFYNVEIKGQDTLTLTLEEVLAMSVEQAIDLKVARSAAAEQSYALEAANLRFKPQLVLDATLPNLNRSIEARPLPDGSDAFVNRSTMYNGLGLSLNYNMEQTGGTLSLNSRFERLDIFKTSEFDYSRTYFSNPLTMTYTQPLFTFNELKWQKQRLSLLNAEFEERYARTREDIILNAIQLFTDHYLASERVIIAREKINDTDSIIEIKNRLFDLGTTPFSEILRLKLDQQNNELALEEAMLNEKQAQVALADFLDLERASVFNLIAPDPLQGVNIAWHQAMDHAMQNRYVTAQHQRRMAEASANVQRAQKNKDIDFDISASLGLNSSGADLRNLFNPLLDREIFTAGLRLPLTGWQRYELQEKVSEEQLLQERLNQEQELQDLSREAFNLVTNFELLKQSLEAIEETKNTTEEILRITRRQFLLGKASHIDISIAAQEREQAFLAYTQTLLDIIDQYYQIRRLCMYDFIADGPLIAE